MIGGRAGSPSRSFEQARQTRNKTRAPFSAGSSEICPYRAYRPLDRKFLAQVTEPQVFVNA
jgi:hypothetical protein